MRADLGAVSALCAAIASASVTTSAARDTVPARSMELASKKDAAQQAPDAPPLLGTLVQTHGDEHLLLDDVEPTQARFDDLLADRVTGQEHPLDPRLLGMLRDMARRYPGARVEIVSGFRSEKLNETLRKKGHHVAVHSQHTLGHAVDFRIVPPGDDRALSPLEIERVLRADLHWEGGVGVYLSDGDWFTHADVGPNRRWNGL
jgi:uncharacterized protein YcbK (DUF882 family)